MPQQHTTTHSFSKADLDLYERVIEAIDSSSVVRETRVPLAVSVEDGVVTVSGVVLSDTMRERVLYAAATVPGVEKVVDNLHSDPEIERAIAGRFAMAEPLRGEHIEITSYRGQVTLVGGVVDGDRRGLAVSLALETPGVREVIDRLAAVGT